MYIINIVILLLIINSMLKAPKNVLGCGLIGGSSPGESPLIIEKLKLLLLYNEKRGDDSSGFWPNSDNEISKALGPVSENILPFTELNNLNNNIFIGHTRAKTIGTATKDNAHPFKFEYKVDKKNKWIIGAHNGTLTNWEALRRYYDYSYGEVNMDSKFILYHHLRYDDNRTFREIGGGVAVIFTMGDNKLKVWRNTERPLFRGNYVTKDGITHMYISSIENSLSAIGCINIKEFKEGYLYTIKDGKILNGALKVKGNPSTTYEIEKLINKKNGVKEKKYYKKEERPSRTDDRRWPYDNTEMSKVYNIDDDYEEDEYYKNFRNTNSWNSKNLNKKVEELEALDGMSVDNYKDDTQSLDDEPLKFNNTLDKVASNINKIEEFKLEQSNNVPTLIKSGMSVERSFLIMQGINNGLENFSSILETMTDKEIAQGSKHIIELLRNWSKTTNEQLLNLIKDVTT